MTAACQSSCTSPTRSLQFSSLAGHKLRGRTPRSTWHPGDLGTSLGSSSEAGILEKHTGHSTALQHRTAPNAKLGRERLQRTNANTTHTHHRSPHGELAEATWSSLDVFVRCHVDAARARWISSETSLPGRLDTRREPRAGVGFFTLHCRGLLPVVITAPRVAWPSVCALALWCVPPLYPECEPDV